MPSLPESGCAEPFPRPWPARAAALAVGLLVVAPALAPGYVLLRDMVFVPRQHLGADALGLSGALPRAVPVDAVVALLSTVVPGQVVQKVALLGLVTAAVLGAARLAPRAAADGSPGAASVVASAVYGWSPYLAERLLLGHWSLLLAWAALPWVAAAGLRVRAGRPGGLPRLVLALAPAALTPNGAVLGGVLALAVVGRTRTLAVVGAAAALSAPWLLAGLLYPGSALSDPAGVDAFAARAESVPGLPGVVLGLLDGGGVWNAAAVPASRASPAAPVITVALVALAVLGGLRTRPWSAPARRVALLGVAGLVLALAGSVPVLADLLRAATDTVPGAGLLRDGQKWVAWWLLPFALGVGAGVPAVADLLVGNPRARTVGVGAAAVALAVLAVPDLAWGVGGRLAPVAWPADWERVAAVLADDPRPGAVLALPASAVRAVGWNAGRTQLDPAPRYLPRDVVVDDDLVVSGRTVAGEDRHARDVLAAADDPGALARAGVGWVLVEHGTPGPALPRWLDAAPRAVRGHWLDLVPVPGAVPGSGPSAGRAAAVIAAHVAAGVLVLGAAASLWRRGGRSSVVPRRRSSR